MKSAILKRGIHFLIVAVLIVCATIWFTQEPRIDPKRVMKLDDMQLGSMTCLIYYDPDPRVWPSSRDERRYIRYLQDHGISVAFLHAEGRTHTALIGFMDGLKIHQLHDDAKSSGIAVPKRAVGSAIEN